ncbi:MAG: hypothetical protein ACT7A5_24385 [Ferrovibrionaceae bacterium]
MRVCLIENRWRIEEFRALASSLLDLGHDVLRLRRDVDLATPDAVAGLSRVPLDLVITSDWFGSFGFAPLAGFAPAGAPPIVDIAFGSLFMEVWNIREAQPSPPDDYLAQGNFWLAVPCRREMARLAALGMTRIVHLPFGTAEGYWADPAVGLDSYGWLRPATHCRQRVTMAELIANTLAGMADGGRGLVHDGVVYLGNPGQDHDAVFQPALDDFAAATPDIAELDVPAIHARIEQFLHARADTAGDDAATRLWRGRVADALAHDAKGRKRRVEVARLHRHLGDRLMLFGDFWPKVGIPARPEEAKLRGFRYARSSLSIDFGSLSFDTALYNRPREIVECGGVLVQAQCFDGVGVWGELEPRMSFSDMPGMLDRIDDLLTRPAERAALAEAQGRHLGTRMSYRRLLPGLFGSLGLLR